MLVNEFCGYSTYACLYSLDSFSPLDFFDQLCFHITHKLKRGTMSGKLIKITSQTPLKFVLSSWTYCFETSGNVSLPLRGPQLLLRHELPAHFCNLSEHHSTLMSLVNSLPNLNWYCIFFIKQFLLFKIKKKQTKPPKIWFPSFFLFILLYWLWIIKLGSNFIYCSSKWLNIPAFNIHL